MKALMKCKSVDTEQSATEQGVITFIAVVTLPAKFLMAEISSILPKKISLEVEIIISHFSVSH